MIKKIHPVTQLESSPGGLGAFISGLAHQLRNPLHGMALRVELLRPEVNEGGERHLDKLRHDIKRLDEALEALLWYVLPGALNAIDFNMNDLLKEVGAQISSARIVVEYKLDSHLPLVHADRQMVYIALTNVVTNAEQAMPDGGTLTLTTTVRGSDVETRVTDQGSGIANEQLPQVFDLYYTTKTTGRGLGLPFARRAIELSGGHITVDPQVVHGTTCTVILPSAHEASA
jgi:two-component system, NtrC family, sensor histidine kinase AtoS